jgi:hypothetical protein
LKRESLLATSEGSWLLWGEFGCEQNGVSVESPEPFYGGVTVAKKRRAAKKKAAKKTAKASGLLDGAIRRRVN